MLQLFANLFHISDNCIKRDESWRSVPSSFFHGDPTTIYENNCAESLWERGKKGRQLLSQNHGDHTSLMIIDMMVHSIMKGAFNYERCIQLWKVHSIWMIVVGGLKNLPVSPSQGSYHEVSLPKCLHRSKLWLILEMGCTLCIKFELLSLVSKESMEKFVI